MMALRLFDLFVRGRVEEFENAFRAGHRRLENVVFFTEILDRPEDPRSVLNEGHDNTDGYATVDDASPP